MGSATTACVMPREGIFVRVIRGGAVAPGASIRRGVGDTRQRSAAA